MAVSIYCPYCNRHTALSMALADCGYNGDKTAAMWKQSTYEKWWIGVCNNCNKPLLVLNEGEEMYPNPLPSPTDVRIPNQIKRDLDEAKQCFSIGAFRATAVMARRSIQSTCIERGMLKGDLVTQINELKTKGIITEDIKEWATLVRWVGNDAAHPNKGEVTGEDAADILHLAEQFLHIIYVAPAIAKERIELRKNKSSK